MHQSNALDGVHDNRQHQQAAKQAAGEVSGRTGKAPVEAKIGVLMVDDEPDLADLIALRLNKRGMKVDVAYTGDQALECVRKVDYDAVILDMKLGRENGQDVLLKLRDLRPDLAVIILTGYGSVESAVKAVKHGAYDFMLKPCDIEDLVAKIREAYRQRA